MSLQWQTRFSSSLGGRVNTLATVVVGLGARAAAATKPKTLPPLSQPCPAWKSAQSAC